MGKFVDYIPEDFYYYILSKKFGWTPKEIDEQDDYMIETYLKYIRIENKISNSKLTSKK